MAALVGGCLALTACGGGDHTPAPTVSWHESASLPVPAGARAVLRDATYCAGRWYVVGATETSSGQTRPAVWSSRDGLQWRSARLDPAGDFYAAQAILGAIGCSRGRVAAVGAKVGGAHLMPRTQSWYRRADGSFVAVEAPYVLYGGVRSVRVGHLVGGPRGFLIAGSRTTGAAVWRSPDGRSFRIEEDAPGLADGGGRATQALDASWHDGAWWVVGISTDRAGFLSAVSWTSADGARWTRNPLPGGHAIATAERAAPTSQGMLAVGRDNGAFGAWTLADGTWSSPAAFGRTEPDAQEAAYVSSLAVAGDTVAVTYSDGSYFRLASGKVGGGWPDQPLPESVPVNGDDQVAVAGHGDAFLLLADDGTRGRVWLGRAPG
jgi:hypothetical protein